jgi:hypothetical protein
MERKRQASECLSEQIFGPIEYSGDPDEGRDEACDVLTA